MKKLVERLLIFFIGLPLIIASVLFLPQYHYLVLHIEILFFSVIAILEMRTILSHKLPVLSVPLSIILGLIIPVASFIYAVFGLSFHIIELSIATAAFFIFCIEFIFSLKGKFADSISRIASSFTLVMYPGYFFMFVSRMCVHPNASALLTNFLLMVFGCDSIAWVIGMLFGKNNRGVIPASPNKSIAGFIGGYIGAIIAGIFSYVVFPDVFGTSIIKTFILALLTATAAIIGDIIESVFKRSAGVKDSGTVIPGRGGVLDSIDSILLAAPAYYIFCYFFIGH